MKISGIWRFGVPVLMAAALAACERGDDAEMAADEPAAMEQPADGDGGSAENTAEAPAEDGQSGG